MAADPRRSLPGGVALVTGAAGGIGAALALVDRDVVQAAWLQRLIPVGYWVPMARDLARRIRRAG